VRPVSRIYLMSKHNHSRNQDNRRAPIVSRDQTRSAANLNSDIASTRKPEHPGIGSLLPFLHERIDLKLPSDFAYLDGVLDYLNERLLKFGIVNPGDSEVLVALDEAIVNAIKHGNKCDPRKAVHILAELSSEGARFKVGDEGLGFSRDMVPDPTCPSRLLEPTGRGLLLINELMDEVRYNECGNQLEMFKRATGELRPIADREDTVATDNGVE
jgi:serine/threonine-protein kinase RsbW